MKRLTWSDVYEIAEEVLEPVLETDLHLDLNEADENARFRAIVEAIADKLMERQGDDPLATPIESVPVTASDGTTYWPGDDRKAVQVRTAHGVLVEQIVHADNLVDALTKAAAIPLADWFDLEDDI